MSTTIFCTFGGQDEADFAQARIRGAHAGVESVTQVTGYGQATGPLMMQNGQAFGRDVTLRIVCTDAARRAVLSRLVNLHASGIITTP